MFFEVWIFLPVTALDPVICICTICHFVCCLCYPAECFLHGRFMSLVCRKATTRNWTIWVFDSQLMSKADWKLLIVFSVWHVRRIMYVWTMDLLYVCRCISETITGTCNLLPTRKSYTFLSFNWLQQSHVSNSLPGHKLLEAATR